LVGAYIELKEPSYFNSQGFPVEKMLLDVLDKFEVGNLKNATEKCPIILQCFEYETLEYFSKVTDLPLVYLIDANTRGPSMEEYSKVVNGVGPEFSLIFTPHYESTGFVAKAHELDLFVHPFTMRDDTLPAGLTPENAYLRILYEKLDGVFTEFPDSANKYFNL